MALAYQHTTEVEELRAGETADERTPVLYQPPGREILWNFDALVEDAAVRELIRRGLTMGCFYIESPAMRSLFKKMRCKSYDEVVAASSVIRPGVAESGMMQEYIKRHTGREQPQHLHPLMGEILAETHGVMIYQEDVIKVAHHLGGCRWPKRICCGGRCRENCGRAMRWRGWPINFFCRVEGKGLMKM